MSPAHGIDDIETLLSQAGHQPADWILPPPVVVVLVVLVVLVAVVVVGVVLVVELVVCVVLVVLVVCVVLVVLVVCVVLVVLVEVGVVDVLVVDVLDPPTDPVAPATYSDAQFGYECDGEPVHFGGGLVRLFWDDRAVSQPPYTCP